MLPLFASFNGDFWTRFGIAPPVSPLVALFDGKGWTLGSIVALVDTKREKQMLLDIATCKESGGASLMLAGFTPREEAAFKKGGFLAEKANKMKCQREKGFPIDTLRFGLPVHLHESEANMRDD